MKFSRLAFVVASMALSPACSHAATITQTATNVSLPSVYAPVDYSDFLAFNSNLGTLNSVTFYVDSVTLSGSFIFNQGAISSSSLTGFTGNVTVYAGAADGPNTHNGQSSGQYNGLSLDINTSSVSLNFSNQTFPVSVSRNNSKTFTLDGSQQLISSPLSFNVTSGDYNKGTYYAPTFTILNEIYATGSQGGNPSFNWSGVQSSANLRLVYDYTAATPVPEPSTYGIGLGVLALAAVAVRRRKLKS